VTLEVRCNLIPWRDMIEIAVLTSIDGKLGIAKPLTYREVEKGAYMGDPTLRLCTGEAQQLMDELWRCGLRPSEGSGSAGALAATERHLADMRQLVFNK
jgi:hypothetical protein